jgi:hypothetical protein
MRSDEIAQHSFDALPKVKSEVEVATEVGRTCLIQRSLKQRPLTA